MVRTYIKFYLVTFFVRPLSPNVDADGRSYSRFKCLLFGEITLSVSTKSVYLTGPELPVWPMNVKMDFVKNNTQLRWNIKHM